MTRLPSSGTMGLGLENGSEGVHLQEQKFRICGLDGNPAYWGHYHWKNRINQIMLIAKGNKGKAQRFIQFTS